MKWAAAVVVPLVGAGLLWTLGRGDPRAALTLAFVSILFTGLHRHRAWTRVARASFLTFVLVCAAGFGVAIVREIRESMREVREWDFLGFWLHARAAASGQNFYDSANARDLAAELSVGEDFEREIVDTGFWYPPPSMFLFLPLGWLDARPALGLWHAFQLAMLAVDVLLLWRVFFPGGTAVELGACAALVCACGGTLTTFYFAQTNFVGLLALLLFWRRRHARTGGFWACVAMLVKPFLAALALGLLAARRWRALSGFVLATLLLTLASIVAFGPATFRDYFTGSRAESKPGWIYDQSTNQSVLGWVLRVTESSCYGADCVANPIFLTLAMALAAVTIPLAWKLAREQEDWTISLLLLLALLVYPVSQLFYSVFLIPPLLAAWRDRERTPGGAATVGTVGALVYALCALDGGRTTVAGTALLWGAMALLGAKLVLEERARSESRVIRPDVPEGTRS